MLCKIIVCLLIIYRFEHVNSKAWPDQSNRYDYSDPSQNWGNPYYGRSEYGSDPTTSSTTTKPLYPTLFPRYQPSAPQDPRAPFPSAPQDPRAPFPSPHDSRQPFPAPHDPRQPFPAPQDSRAPFPAAPSAPTQSNRHQFEDDGQRQVQPNPFEVLPLQPHVGGNRNSNHTQNNRNGYSDNNFNYPFDNTRTTYPPFDGSTKRPTFPTRQPFNHFPSAQGIGNNNASRSVNPFGAYNDQHNYNSRNPSSNGFNQNYNNSGSSAYRPFPSANQFNQQGHNGNPYQNQPNHQPNHHPNHQPNYQPNNQPTYQPTQPSYQPNYQPTQQPSYQPNKGAFNANQSALHSNNGSPYQSNYQSNHGNPNQGHYDRNIHSEITSQTSQPQMNQKPEYSVNGIALAPFPDVSSNTNNNYNDGRKYFNHDNVQHRQPPTNIQPEVNGRFSGPSEVPLAGYSGAHVPLA